VEGAAGTLGPALRGRGTGPWLDRTQEYILQEVVRKRSRKGKGSRRGKSIRSTNSTSPRHRGTRETPGKVTPVATKNAHMGGEKKSRLPIKRSLEKRKLEGRVGGRRVRLWGWLRLDGVVKWVSQLENKQKREGPALSKSKKELKARKKRGRLAGR